MNFAIYCGKLIVNVENYFRLIVGQQYVNSAPNSALHMQLAWQVVFAKG